MTDLMRWFLRFWLLFAFCWLAVIGHAQQSELCAAREWPAPKERAARAATLERNLAIPGQSVTGRELLVADFEKQIAAKPAFSCAPTAFSGLEIRRSGGYTIDWSVRLPALILWLMPPGVVFVVGLMLLWAAGTFRQTMWLGGSSLV